MRLWDLQRLPHKGVIMSQINPVTRRSALATMAGAAGAFIAKGAGGGSEVSAAPSSGTEKGKGRLKQSVCKWCYSRMSVEDLSRSAAGMGIRSVELLGPDDWPTVKKHGLTCAMASGPGGIEEGW